jgi:hypothetical protein
VEINRLFLDHIVLDWDAGFLSKARGGRKRRASGGTKRSLTDERDGEGGPDEAVAFIAETVAELVKLAKSHRLEVLSHLLGMAQLEAEERLRTRSKRKLS